jgi:hypothetical protein
MEIATALAKLAVLKLKATSETTRQSRFEWHAGYILLDDFVQWNLPKLRCQFAARIAGHSEQKSAHYREFIN